MSGSTQATTSGGEQFQDVRLASYRSNPDGSYSQLNGEGAGVWNFKNLTGSNTTVVKSSAGQLYGFYVGTATGNITIYDNTAASGTKILDTSAVPTAGAVVKLPAGFSTGLTIVLSGAAVVTALYL